MSSPTEIWDGGLRELISTAFALLALENSLSFQFQKNQFEKLSWNLLTGRQIRDQNRTVP